MPTNVVMPQLGESVVEGTVSKWLKQPGDSVAAFEPLLEVSTDKVETEIPAPADGVLLSIQVEAGATVAHGTILAVIGAAGELDAPVFQNDTPPTPLSGGRTAPASAPLSDEGRTALASAPLERGRGGAAAAEAYTGHITPVVARMAAEHRLDLALIPGTGREGRITKKDVEAYLDGRRTAPEKSVDPWDQPGSGDLFKPTVDYSDAAVAGTQNAASAMRSAPAAPIAGTHDEASAGLVPSVANSSSSPGRLIPLSPMRRAIADHMVRSQLHTSPHVTTVFEVDLSAVVAHRAAHKADYAESGVNLTLTAYFVIAAAAGLRAVPSINAEWREGGIFYHYAQHIGMAVALDEGLIVPVIRHAGDLNLIGAARAVGDLATRARAKALKADEVAGGTFTITNHGTSGSLFATPIINQPQVGIMGVGAMEKRVRVITDSYGNDMIAVRPCAYVSLTFDHRVADGAAGDAFLMEVRRLLTDWQ